LQSGANENRRENARLTAPVIVARMWRNLDLNWTHKFLLLDSCRQVRMDRHCRLVRPMAGHGGRFSGYFVVKQTADRLLVVKSLKETVVIHITQCARFDQM
jgi:hypothetical protein